MVAVNYRISSCVQGVRELAVLTPLVFGFYVGLLFLIGGGIPNAHGSTSFYYIVSRPDSSYMSQIDACSAAMDMNENSSGVPSDAINPRPSWDENGNCVVYYNVPNYNYGVSLAIVIDGGPATVRSKACKSGEPKTLTWPAGRLLTPGDETSFQEFGSSPPNPACFSGCSATRSGFSDNPYYSPENAQLIVQDYPYITDGAACAADTPAPEVPDFPSPPGEDDGGDAGGGDTGGGDTGGGDTGGGDAGGSAGGGDTGGDTGGSTGGGGGSGGSGGGSSGIPIDPPDDGLPDDLGDPGGSTGGDTGGSTGGDTGGSTGDGTGGSSGGDVGGSTGGDDGAGNSAGGLACNQALTCEGDPVQCAILRTQKEQLCADLDGADFEGHKGEIDSLFSGPDFQREADEEVTVPSFVTGITRFFPSNSCPADASVSLSSFGGRTLKFSFEPICSFATALGPLIVIAATVFAALYVGRAFGGE